MQNYGDNFIPMIQTEDAWVHTGDRTFCDDPNCGCHEEPDLLSVVNYQVQEGLLTPSEATRTVEGKQL